MLLHSISAYPAVFGLQVPRSSRLIAEDQDYALVSVVLFKRVVDDFKTEARLKGFQVRMGGRQYKAQSAHGMHVIQQLYKSTSANALFNPLTPTHS